MLDRLLEDEIVEIAAISGTSAGALNAAALKAGYLAGGRSDTRENLDWFWGQVGAVTAPEMQGWLAALAPSVGPWANALAMSPGDMAFDVMSHVTSPYAYGPAIQNPLRKIVDDMRFDDNCAPEGPRLFIGETNVRTGKIRVFDGADISPDALLASASLPTSFKAVEIYQPKICQTEAYWDGG